MAGRLSAPDQYRSAFTCLCARLFSSVILSFAEPCSFVVHLLCCVGSIYLISSLNPLSPPPPFHSPIITNSRIFSARSSSACRPHQVLSSNVIQLAHLPADRADEVRACALRKNVHAMRMRFQNDALVLGNIGTETHKDLPFSRKPAQPLTGRLQVVFPSQPVDRD